MPRRRPRPGLSDLRPLHILLQIFQLQGCYYGTAIVLIVFVSLVAGEHPNPDIFFNWHNVRGDVTTGWTLGLCWILTSLITVIPILLLIARSKLVPDFALTIHLIHLIVTSAYTRAIPTSISWWLVQVVSAGIMVSLGIWACQWRELQPMAFGGKGKEPVAKSIANGHPPEAGPSESGEGFAMGSGRGRGRDGAGTYEMVGMAPREPV